MELNEQEAHCLARFLQSALFAGEQGLYTGCEYCKYQCNNEKEMRIDSIKRRLSEETGVDFVPIRCGFLLNSDFPYHIFLKNANEKVREYFRTRFADYLRANCEINGQ